jgi:hypothetical protein
MVGTTARRGRAKPSSRITLNVFMTGLIAGLASRRVKVVTIGGPSFYAAVVKVFEELEKRASADPTINLRFWLTQDELHKDSPEIRDSITSAVQRRLVSLDNPTYQTMRMKIDGPEEASAYLESLPGGPDLYLELAAVFTRVYPEYA